VSAKSKGDWPLPVLFSSACWEAAKCFYDGSCLRSPFVRSLGGFSRLFPICPEMACGRQLIRRPLVEYGGDLKEEKGGADHRPLIKKNLRFWRRGLMPPEGVLGNSFSPLCRWEEKGERKGLLQEILEEVFPLLTGLDERGWREAETREHFLTAIFLKADWKRQKKTPGGLQDFHRRHKYLFMALDPRLKDEMGRIAAGKNPSFVSYQEKMLLSLKEKPSRSRHANALLHVFGYYSDHLPATARREFPEMVEDYVSGSRDIDELRGFLRSLQKKYKNSYLRDQSYLEPYPRVLGLVETEKSAGEKDNGEA